MTTGMRAAGWGLLIVGLLAAAIGFLILGILPVRVDGRTCGNAYDTRDTAFALQFTSLRNDCSGPLHSRRVAAFTTGGVGAGVMLLSVAGLLIPAAAVDRQNRRTQDLA